MENKNFLQELAEYRVRIERNGREIVNIPGILCLPGLLAAPKMSIAGLAAASLLGCSVHMGHEEEKEKADLEQAVKNAAETVMNRVGATAKTVAEQFEKAWQDMTAADESGADEAEEKTAQEEESGRVVVEEPEKEKDDSAQL